MLELKQSKMQVNTRNTWAKICTENALQLNVA